MMRVAAALIILLLLPSPALAKDAKEEAKERFDKGVKLFKSEDLEAALVEFKAAYAAQPHYRVKYNIGITLYRLHRYVEAYETLESYIHEGGSKIPDDKRKEVIEILKELKTLIGTLEVNCNVNDAVLFVDGEPQDKWVVKLQVGVYRIEVSAYGHVPFTKTVEIPGGKSLAVKAELSPLEGGATKKPRQKLPAQYFWSGVGLTGALALTAAITGGLALKTQADYRELDAEDDWKSVQRKAKNLALATDVLWGVAGAAAITTVIIAIFTDFEGGERKEAGLTLTPTIGTPGLILQGSF